MTETLPRRDEQPMAQDTRNIIRLLAAMNRRGDTLSVDEMSCVLALSRMQEGDVWWFEHVFQVAQRCLDAPTRYQLAELVRAVGDET